MVSTKVWTELAMLAISGIGTARLRMLRDLWLNIGLLLVNAPWHGACGTSCLMNAMNLCLWLSMHLASIESAIKRRHKAKLFRAIMNAGGIGVTCYGPPRDHVTL